MSSIRSPAWPVERRSPTRARIYFDWNDPIDTPLVLNTVDAEAPTGRIEPFDGHGPRLRDRGDGPLVR